MAAKKRIRKSADEVIFHVLAYEFSLNERSKAEQKIRGRLKYHGRPYRQQRVDKLRRFKDEIQTEIFRRKRSRYFLGFHGECAAMEDFDIECMIEDFSNSYPEIPRRELKVFIPFAVYLYYLR